MTTSQEYLKGGSYPPNWHEIADSIRERAGQQCEWIDHNGQRCPRRHHEPIPHAPHRKTVLTVAHLNHDPTDNRPENLRAWCQVHHLRYDAPMHAQHAQATLRRKKREGQLDAGQLSLSEEEP